MIDEVRLPERPACRRVVVGLDEVSFDRLVMEDSRDLARRSDVAVVNVERAAHADDVLAADLVRQGVCRPGQVLVQNPFDQDDYIAVEKAPDAFAVDKATRMSMLVAILGAKKLRLTSVEDDSTRTRWEADAEASRRDIKVKGDGSRTRAESFARKIKLEDTFPGADPDIPAAREYLRRSNLAGDRELRSLVDAREVTSNPLSKRTFSLDLSSDAEETIDLALELAAMPLLKGKVAVNGNRVTKAHYRVEYEIEF